MDIKQDLQREWRTGGVLMRLVLINVAVFLLLRLIDLPFWMAQTQGPDILLWLESGSSLSLLLHRPWTVVTYMFTHWGIGHIFFNMLILWFVGRIFQDLLGERRLLGNYLLGGFAGLFLYVIAFNFIPVFSRYAEGSTIMGASAGVMAVFIGLATYRPDLELHLLFFGRVKLKWLALIYLVLDLIGIREGDNSGGHIAHLGGALYGILAGRMLMQGTDISLSFVNALDRFFGLFRRKGPKLRVAHDQRGARTRSDASFNAGKQAKQARIDAILDKISRSGYDSLSKEEKDILFRESNGR